MPAPDPAGWESVVDAVPHPAVRPTTRTGPQASEPAEPPSRRRPGRRTIVIIGGSVVVALAAVGLAVSRPWSPERSVSTAGTLTQHRSRSPAPATRNPATRHPSRVDAHSSSSPAHRTAGPPAPAASAPTSPATSSPVTTSPATTSPSAGRPPLPGAGATPATAPPGGCCTLPPELAALRADDLRGFARLGLAARWTATAEGGSDSGQIGADDSCAPPVAAKQAWHSRHFALTDVAQGVHGAIESSVFVFATVADASRFVAVRRSPTFAACIGRGDAATLTDPQAADAVGRPVPTLLLAVGDGVGYRITTPFTRSDGPCTSYVDHTWTAIGTDVVATTFATCGTPWNLPTEQSRQALVVARLANNAAGQIDP